MLLYLMVLCSGYSTTKSILFYNNEEVNKGSSTIIKLGNTKHHKILHRVNRKDEKTSKEFDFTRSTKIYSRPFNSFKTSTKTRTIETKYMSPKRKLSEFWKKFKGKNTVKKKGNYGNNEIYRDVSTENRQEKTINSSSHRWKTNINNNQIAKQNCVTVRETFFKKKIKKHKRDLNKTKSSITRNTKSKSIVQFKSNPIKNESIHLGVGKAKITSGKHEKLTSKKYAKTTAKELAKITTTEQVQLTSKTPNNHIMPEAHGDIKTNISGITAHLENLKEKYKIKSDGSVSSALAVTSTFDNDARNDYDFVMTAQVEDVLNNIKTKAIQMIDQSNFSGDALMHVEREKSLDIDPLLVYSSSVLRPTLNSSVPTMIDYAEMHHPVARSLQENMKTTVTHLGDMIQNKIKNIINKIKVQVIKNKKTSQKSTTKFVKQKHKNIKFSKTTPTCSMTQHMRKSTTPAFKTHNKQKRATSLHIPLKHILYTFTNTVKPLYENIFKKVHDSTLKKTISKLSSKKKAEDKSQHRSIKRNPKTLTKLIFGYGGGSIPDEYFDTESIISVDPDKPETCTAQDSSIRQGSNILLNNITNSGFVNGYKHYLKFQKALGDDNFSAQVKYQAHKHHKVDEIGKFILEKIPPTSSYQFLNKTQRVKRYFNDINAEVLTTKTPESRSKNHFNLLLNNGSPEKLHVHEKTRKILDFGVRVKRSRTDETITDKSMNMYSYKDSVVTSKGTLANRMPHSKEKDSLKYGSVNINVLIPKRWDVITLRENNASRSKFKDFFKRFEFRGSRAKNKTKRSYMLNNRYPRYNPFKLLKDIFKNSNENNIPANFSPWNYDNHLPNYSDSNSGSTLDYEDITLKDAHINDYRPSKFDNSLSTIANTEVTLRNSNTHSDTSNKYENILNIDDMEKQVANISVDNADNVNWTMTTPLSTHHYNIEDLKPTSFALKLNKSNENVVLKHPISTTRGTTRQNSLATLDDITDCRSESRKAMASSATALFRADTKMLSMTVTQPSELLTTENRLKPMELDYDIDNIEENAENNKYVLELPYNEQIDTEVSEIDDILISNANVASTELYKNQENFNYLLNGRDDDLNSDEVVQTLYTIDKNTQEDYGQTLSAFSVHKIIPELQPPRLELDENTDLLYSSTATLPNYDFNEGNKDFGVLRGMKLIDNTNGKDYIIKGEAAFLRYNRPIDIDAINIAHKTQSDSSINTMPRIGLVRSLINSGIAGETVNQDAAIIKKPYSSSIAPVRPVINNVPSVTLTAVTKQELSSLRTPANLHFNKGVRRGNTKGIPASISIPALMIDTTLLSYDDEVDTVAAGIHVKKLSKNSLRTYPARSNAKTTPDNFITKLNNQPPHYYTTPLPMNPKEFEKFLKNEGLDVKSLTEPLSDTTDSLRTTLKKNYSLSNDTILNKDFKAQLNSTETVLVKGKSKGLFILQYRDRYKKFIKNPSKYASTNFNYDRLKRINIDKSLNYIYKNGAVASKPKSVINHIDRGDKDIYKKIFAPISDMEYMKRAETFAVTDELPTFERNEKINTEEDKALTDYHTTKSYSGPAVHNQLLYNTNLNQGYSVDKANLKAYKPILPAQFTATLPDTFRPLFYWQKKHSARKMPKKMALSSHHYKYDIFYDGFNENLRLNKQLQPLKIRRSLMQHRKLKGRTPGAAMRLSIRCATESSLPVGHQRLARDAPTEKSTFSVGNKVSSFPVVSTKTIPSRKVRIIALLTNKFASSAYIQKTTANKNVELPKEQESGLILKVDRCNTQGLCRKKGVKKKTHKDQTCMCCKKSNGNKKEDITMDSSDLLVETVTPVSSNMQLNKRTPLKFLGLGQSTAGTSTSNADFIYLADDANKFKRSFHDSSGTKQQVNGDSEKMNNADPTSFVQDKMSPLDLDFHMDKKRAAQNNKVFTAKDVAALEIIIDLMKSTLSYNYNNINSGLSNNSMFGLPIKFVQQRQDSSNYIQVHIGLPHDAQPEKKRCLSEPVWVRKVFSAKMLTPVDMEYQVHPFEASCETTAAISTTTTDDGLSPGIYLLINRPNNGYALKSVKAKKNIANVHYHQVSITPLIKQETMRCHDDIKNTDKVTLSKNLITVINKQLVELYETSTASYAADGPARRKRRVHFIPGFDFRGKRHKPKEKIKLSDDPHNRVGRLIDWNAIKHYFGEDRVCNCKCKPYKPMCRACAASDAVINELIFEFNNIEQYMKDHCTELQTFFWMNPSGGLQLRDTVHNIDKSLHDYYKRVRGKCQGKTCKAFGTNIDKRQFSKNTSDSKENNINQLVSNLDTIKNDLNKTIKISTCFNPRLEKEGRKMLKAINSCIFPKNFKKRADTLYTKKKLFKNVYSLNNINVNIICNPDIQPTESFEPPVTITTLAHASTTTSSTSTNSLATDSPSNSSSNQIITTENPRDQENLLKFNFYDEIQKPKKRKSFKCLFAKKNKKDKLLHNYTIHYMTLKPLFKRDTCSQIEIPLSSNSGGTFWLDVFHSSSSDKTYAVTPKKPQHARHKLEIMSVTSTFFNSKKSEKVTDKDDLMQTDTSKFEVMKIKTNEVNNSIPQPLIQKEFDSEMSTEYLTNYINKLLTIYGNVQDIESIGTQSNRVTQVSKLKPKNIDKIESKLTMLPNNEANQKSNSSFKPNTTVTISSMNTTAENMSINTHEKLLCHINTTTNKKTTTQNRPVSIGDIKKKMSVFCNMKLTRCSDKSNKTTKIFKTSPKHRKQVTDISTPITKKNQVGSYRTVSVTPSNSITVESANTLSKTSPQTFVRNNIDRTATVSEKGEIKVTKSTTVSQLPNKKSNKIYRNLQKHFKSATLRFLGLTKADVETVLINNVNKTTSNEQINISDISTLKSFTSFKNYDNRLKNIENTERSKKKSKCKNLLLSIIQYESKKLNDEWQKVANGSKTYSDDRYQGTNRLGSVQDNQPMDAEIFKDIKVESTQANNPQDDAVDIIKDIKNKINDIRISAATDDRGNLLNNDITKPSDYLGSTVTKIDVKILTAGNNNKKVAKQSYLRESEQKYLKSKPVEDISLREASDSYQPSNIVCSLQSTYNHVTQLRNELRQNEFEAFVKNIPCYKYKRMRRNFFINHKSRGMKWDWIRSKRSLSHRANYKNKEGHLHESECEEDVGVKQYYDAFETFIRDEDGIYRVVSRNKRKADENAPAVRLETPALLLPTMNQVFAMLDDSISLECLTFPHHQSSRSPDRYTWETDREDMMEQDNVETEGPTLVITKVRPRNSGTYSCIVDNVLHRNIRLNVMTLPSIDVVFVPSYRLPRECTYRDLKAIQLLAREMSKEISCGDVCSIRIDEPVCQTDRAKNRSLIRSTTVLTVTPRKMKCSVQCRRDLHSSMVRLSAANIPALKSANVVIFRDGVNETLIPCKDNDRCVITHMLQRKDSNGHHEYHKLSAVPGTEKTHIVIVCNAGYYLMRDQNLCALCPSNTTSSLGENSCTPCPQGTRSDPGSGVCRKHNRRHRRYDWWWYPPCGYLVAATIVVCACGTCLLLSLVVQLASRTISPQDKDDKATLDKNTRLKTSSACERLQYSANRRPLSPSRVILARFFKPSLTSSRATPVDSQETKFDLWKGKNIPPPLPAVDFDLENDS